MKNYIIIIILILIFIIYKKKENFSNDDIKKFKSVWNKKNKKDAINLLKYFHNFCKKNNINYFLHYGTLIGQQRHNGIIPWDDDMDVVAEKKSFEKIFKYLENDKIKIIKYSYYYKLFYKDNKSKHNYPWTWPFLDIFLYTTNSDKLIIKEWENKEKEYLKTDILPFKKAKFEELFLNIPKNSIKILNNYYPNWKEKCKSGNWDHKYEKSKKEVTLPCKMVILNLN